MKTILYIIFLLFFFCSCGKQETDELCPRFFNDTPDILKFEFFINSNGRTENVSPNSLSSIWMIPCTLDILDGLNSNLDSINIYDDYSHLICKFTKTSTFNYRGNPFTDRNKWEYQGIKREKRRTQTITYVNLHEYWFKIEYDSIIIHP